MLSIATSWKGCANNVEFRKKYQRNTDGNLKTPQNVWNVTSSHHDVNMKHGYSVHLGPSRWITHGGEKKRGIASSGDVLLWRWFGLTAWIYNQVGSALKGELRNNLDFLHKEICFVWVKCGGEISSLNSDFLIWILTIGLDEKIHPKRCLHMVMKRRQLVLSRRLSPSSSKPTDVKSRVSWWTQWQRFDRDWCRMPLWGWFWFWGETHGCLSISSTKRVALCYLQMFFWESGAVQKSFCRDRSF